jgi:hypothetical protein
LVALLEIIAVISSSDFWKMLPKTIVIFGFITLTNALIRFPCSQLVVERLDPLVEPGVKPGAHLHQIVGGVCILPLHILFTLG